MAEYPQLLHTVLDTTDVRQLAEFYRELLGLQYRPGDEPPAEPAPSPRAALSPTKSQPAPVASILSLSTRSAPNSGPTSATSTNSTISSSNSSRSL